MFLPELVTVFCKVKTDKQPFTFMSQFQISPTYMFLNSKQSKLLCEMRMQVIVFFVTLFKDQVQHSGNYIGEGHRSAPGSLQLDLGWNSERRS